MIRPGRPYRAGILVPPFPSLEYPVLDAGTALQAVRAAGGAGDVHRLNQEYAEVLGRRRYQGIAELPGFLQVGEWIGAAPLREASGVSAQVVEARRHVDFRSFLRAHGPPDLTDRELVTIEEAADGMDPFLRAVAGSERWERYDLLLLCCRRHQLGAGLALGQALEDAGVEAPVFLFGPQVADLERARSILESFPFVSGVVVRSAPDVLERSLEALVEGAEVPGVMRRPDGRETHYVEPAAELRRGPLSSPPRYDGFFDEHVDDPSESVLPYQASHGCWWGDRATCTFCGLIEEGQTYVSKEPDTVVEEIVALVREHRSLSVVAADLLLDYDYIDTVFARLEELDFDLDLFFEVRPDLKKRDLRQLRDGGLTGLVAGIESFDDASLKAMRKGTTALHNVRFIKWCTELGLRLSWNLLYGFPGETPERLERQAELLPKLAHLLPPLNVSPVRLTRGSPFHAEPERYGLRILGPDEPWLHSFPLPLDALDSIADEYAFEYADGSDPRRAAGPLVDVASRWVAGWSPDRLYWLRGPGFVKIFDHRDDASETVTLTGWHATAFERLDDVTTTAALYRSLGENEEGISMEDVKELLGTLESRGLVVGSGERWISVVPRGRPLRLARAKLLRERTAFDG